LLYIAIDQKINEYGMHNGCMEIKTKAALATYVLQNLQVEYRFLERDATAQQLVLENLEDVKPYLFSA
jgi:hypothetical protein